MPGSTPASPALSTARQYSDANNGSGASPAQPLQVQIPSVQDDDMLNEHQYASLLQAVSNIHMSARPTHLDQVDDRDGHLSPHSNNHSTSNSNNNDDDIYDLRHVIVHHQREYEQHMRQMRHDYRLQDSPPAHNMSTQTPTPPPVSDPSASSTFHSLPSAIRVHETPSPELPLPLPPPLSSGLGGVANHLFSPVSSPSTTLLFGTFENRPTISSSYFPSSMESTIVLSSPPPGRSNHSFQGGHQLGPLLPQSTLPSTLRNQAPDSNATIVAGPSLTSPFSVPSHSHHSPPPVVVQQQQGNGPYRPYVTGRDIASAPLLQTGASNPMMTPTLTRNAAMTMSTFIPTSSSSPSTSGQQEELAEEFRSDGGRTLVGNHGTGQWSAFGSLIPFQPSPPSLTDWSEAIHFRRQRQRHFQRLFLDSQQPHENQHQQPWTPPRDVDGDVTMGALESNHPEDHEDEKLDPEMADPSDAQLEHRHRRQNSTLFEAGVLGYSPLPSLLSVASSLPRPPRDPARGNSYHHHHAQHALQSPHTLHPSLLPIASRYLHPPPPPSLADGQVSEPTISLAASRSRQTSSVHARQRSGRSSGSNTSAFILNDDHDDDDDEHDHPENTRRLSPTPYSITVDSVEAGGRPNNQPPSPHSLHHNNNSSSPVLPLPVASPVPIDPSTPTTTTTATTAAGSTGSQTSTSHYTNASSQTASSLSSSGSHQEYRFYPSSYRAYYSTNEDFYSLQQQRQIGLKEVVRMACRFCGAVVCERGMKAQLLADQTIGLFSTDDAPVTVELIGDAYRPTNCSCEISDTACLVCGNAIGYHIMQPCKQCLSAENNGHLWLFHPEYVTSAPRLNLLLAQPLRWQDLPHPDQDDAAKSLGRPVQRIDPKGRLVMGGMVRRDYDSICR